MNDFVRIWEECWTRVARGEATIEDCVTRYPKYADELRRLFAVVVGLSQGRLVRPRAEYKARARAELLAQIRSRSQRRVFLQRPEPSRTRVIPLSFRAGLVLAVTAFLLLVSGTMLAQAALPGDLLYRWKIGSEDIFRSVYPDPVTADLALTNRRADELTRVVGTPAAEQVVQQEYQKLLSDLPRHNNPASESKIREQLTEQKARLQRAGVNMPAIDQTLGNLSAAPANTATPTVTPTEVKTTPALSASATPSMTPSPVSTASPRPSATRTRLRTAVPSPTRDADATAGPTARAKSTETLTATPCDPQSPAIPLTSDPCTTPTSSSCRESSATPSCETPTRTMTPTSPPVPVTESPTPTPTRTPTPTPTQSPIETSDTTLSHSNLLPAAEQGQETGTAFGAITFELSRSLMRREVEY